MTEEDTGLIVANAGQRLGDARSPAWAHFAGQVVDADEPEAAAVAGRNDARRVKQHVAPRAPDLCEHLVDAGVVLVIAWNHRETMS